MFSNALLLLAATALPALAEVHKIDVGDGAMAFKPEAIFANVGDQVVFTFKAKNHTVTQSSFADPCKQAPDGFDSGFQAVAPGATELPSYTITVSDTKPIWVFCRQAAETPASHCGAGMVFSVNCGADGAPNSFTNFKNAALAQGEALKAAAPPSTDSGYGSGYGAPAPAPAAPSDAPAAAPSDAPAPAGQTAPTTPATNGTGTIHTVTVGGNSALTFDPPNVVAAPQDTIKFVFQSKNHTVTQSSFAAPCRKLEATSTTGQTGFDSGYMPVAAGTTDFPSWSFTVNDTAPIWAYCRQTTPVSHCGMGMVFSVNADEASPRNSTAFSSLAKSLNGTAASPAGGAAPTTTAGVGGSANSAAHVRPAGVAFVAVALTAIFLL